MAAWDTFESYISLWNPSKIQSAANSITDKEVSAALITRKLEPSHLLALLSPAAEARLEDLAQAAHRLTLERFGRIVQLYAPVYLSNECVNRCLYCGFNADSSSKRSTLDDSEIIREASSLSEQGFRHILLVSGDHPKKIPPEKIKRAITICSELFSSISIETYGFDREWYQQLITAGCDGVTLYQETYDPKLYKRMHPQGRKSDYHGRLRTIDDAGSAGMRRLNIGSLLGLGPWLPEAMALGLHARYLSKRHWKTQIAVSFPRLCETSSGFQAPKKVGDRALVQMICALRLFLPDSPLVVSTRESAQFRDNLIPLGITQMSAGSRTEPGGYNHPEEAGEQFSVSDRRSPGKVAQDIRNIGFEPVWKDWDTAFLVEKGDSR